MKPEIVNLKQINKSPSLGGVGEALFEFINLMASYS